MSATDTNDNPGRIVFVISWLLFCVVWLAVGARLATRWTLSRKLGGDDILTLVALAFSSGQTGAMTVAISNGLGQRINTLSSFQVTQFQQSLYASNLLYIFTLYFAKTAVLALLIQLTPDESHRRISIGLAIFIAFWAITAVFAASFQCHLPHSWQFIGNRCFNLTAFWNYFEILNIITDFVLIVLPAFVMWRVQINWRRKAAVASCFASRALVITAAISQLALSQHAYSSKDPTSDIWKDALCGQMVQNLSVITCCVPYLKPFYLGLESGMIRTDDLRRHGLVGAYGYGTQKSEQWTANSDSRNRAGPADQSNVRGKIAPFKNQDVQLDNLTTITAGGRVKPVDWEARSLDSQNSQVHIIRQTVGWTVNSEA
ncbi:MAG: hypothetical protein M1818_007392 [Claussenomyces sp. TS43310]|nr:MAG: hypothetical protein M1818_007392 [Claussenomyces sp. TS43310]